MSSSVGILSAAMAQTPQVPQTPAESQPATAAEAPAPCTTGPVYMVVSGRTLDARRMGAYSRALLGSGLYPLYGGYYLNSPKPIEIFEGSVVPEFAELIVRFPCLSNARAFWNSERYQRDIRPLRMDPSAGDYTVAVYAELALPAYMAGRVVRPDFKSPFVPESAAAGGPNLSAASPVMRRASIVVTDTARALSLFEATLGFKPGATKALAENSSAPAVFGVQGRGSLRWTTLSAGAEQPDVVGILEAQAAAVPPGQATRSSASLAPPATALVILTRGRLAGLERFITAQRLPVLSRSPLASPIYGEGIELAFRDWDGNLLVVVDFT